ncbi:hypothetical protein DICPUDRAFT_152686 [Dictyostelium purpureum]|uniref:FNIP repeat-containing protein n=1 Tax=Dictyostelium purpureum TaxID=5786 RepID=F0ZM14_DICPU|nr:uncharacterized protein DICPUDRAFT_152686 [Dictyostelium purpureum]EGC35033.1 hypothetical protein DICPUDRAFT_152686 [Dictyostelium purpureum]|eukprot:XP_003288461.1 hypothetical protein DICPUDRAFT_152686 [Dictyostelium purpureum]
MNNNTVIINNNNNNNDIDNKNNILFFRVFRNIYLREKIFHFLHLYNIFKFNIFFRGSYQTKERLKYLEYFKSVYIEDEDEHLYRLLELIPKNIEYVKIGGVPLFCSNIYSMYIPKHIKHLVLSDVLNDSENDSTLLPGDLEVLEINDINKQSWNFPSKLKKLIYTISDYRNSQATELPQNLKSLKLVNCSLNFFCTLPQTLKKLKVYNRSISKLYHDMRFPQNTEVLYLYDGMFNRPLQFLPQTLLKLELDPSFDQSIPVGVLPETLKKLVLKNESPKYSFIQCEALPIGLKVLKLGSGYRFDSLPPNITTIQCNHELIDLFPQSVTQYKFDYQFERFFFEETERPNLSVLPDHIKSIKCVSRNNLVFKSLFIQKKSNIVLDSYRDMFKVPINSILPLQIISSSKSITRLDFSYSINTPIPPNTLPPNLKSLKLNWYYDEPFLQGTLPPSLQSLSLGYYYTKALENLPNQLLIFEFLGNLNTNIDLIQQLPTSVKILIIPFIKLTEEIIPTNVETIFIAEGTTHA